MPQSPYMPIFADSLSWTVYQITDVRLEYVSRLKETYSAVLMHTTSIECVPVTRRRTSLQNRRISRAQSEA